MIESMKRHRITLQIKSKIWGKYQEMASGIEVPDLRRKALQR